MNVVVSVLLLLGSALALLAGIGVLRLPDVFARLHAATKTATLGVLLILVAAAIEVSGEGQITKLALAAVLVVVTGPAASHMIGRAAHRAGTEVNPRNTVVDELAAERAAAAAARRRRPPA